MNPFTLLPLENSSMGVVCSKIFPVSTNIYAFVFAADYDRLDQLAPADIFRNAEDDCLYCAMEIKPVPDDDTLRVVFALKEFRLSAEEFIVLMQRLPLIDEVEKQHRFGDALMARIIRQMAPDYAIGVGFFEGMDKLYA